MIEATNITDHQMFTGADNWLDRYVQAAKHARFPLSYHLLSGIFALTTTIGRRGRIKLPGFVLWPPVSVLLIGESGTGKTKSLKIAREVLQLVKQNIQDPFFIMHEDDWTPSGLIDQWRIWQSQGEPGFNRPLEGAYTCDEAGTVLKKSTGKEGAANFLINTLEHDNLARTTASRGRRVVQDICIAFGLTTTVSDMRDSLSGEIFAGGFMHRFMISHEIEKPSWGESDGDVPEEVKRELALEALAIREDCPDDMEIQAATLLAFEALENKSEARHFPLACMRGFWNRFPGYAMKLGAARALSDHRYSITVEDLEAGERLVEEFLYKPLVELVEEISSSPKQKLMYKISDDLYAAGPAGLSVIEVERKVGPISGKGGAQFIDHMQRIGLMFAGLIHTERWYRLEGWAADEGNGD